jgi:hypothetical protein
MIAIYPPLGDEEIPKKVISELPDGHEEATK